jgi:hypothetical protein
MDIKTFILENFVSPSVIRKGDTVRCIGKSYPHWKGMEFECTMKFPNDTIGLMKAVRVDSRDFRPVKTYNLIGNWLLLAVTVLIIVELIIIILG